jgi:hypothetical protein
VAGTAKLPAPVQQSRAPAPASAKAAASAPSSGGGGAAGTFKLLVWLLVILNVVAAGGWAYLKFFKNGDAEKNLTTSRRRLVNLQGDLDVLQSTVRSIAANGINEVEDPGGLISDVAKPLGLSDAIQYGSIQQQRFYRTSYTEKWVKVTFLGKRIYKFGDVVRFLTLIEAANPTVQIKEIDFGKRYPQTIGTNGWTPTTATVRTLQLTSQPGG